MTILYLVRHCEAFGNIKRIFQGHIDSEISDNGQKQLDRLTERFRDIPLDGIVSSPLKRAYLTAQAVNGDRGLPVETDRRLMEINGGRWEGKPWDDLDGLYPEESAAWLKAPWDFHPEEGESMRAVYERMAAALTDIARRYEGKTVAVASHGCAIRNALCWMRGWPVERLNEVPWADNTSVALLEFDDHPHGEPSRRIVYENDNSHLGKEISTFEKQSWWRK
ncbi:MAG: histidine phosphatase family protein [Clostridiales bacterium]|nr:histidine phosphatase family protein [Clostridiales bacterium]